MSSHKIMRKVSYWSVKRGRPGVVARDKAREIGCGKIMLQSYKLC